MADDPEERAGGGRMPDDGDHSYEPCRFCEGTGRVEVDRCAEVVDGRRCRNFARNDPAYYEEYPARAWLRPYCGMHGNERFRESVLGA